MSNYWAKNPKELDKALREIQKKGNVMVKGIQSNLGRVTLNGAQIVEARAKEIIKEKGHVITGTLGRSINSQLEEVTYSVARANIGTFVEYGPAIENLPDGGFLFPALEETAAEVSEFLYSKGVKPHLEGWAR